ncbi:DUF2062 domain-containing protein [uncultured Sphingomonas sp.]|uniref:DUF2062 domain-containing protein n=1 Tax=uncultured Sphingomonas sp. TaxID=158754 RepID=UPI0025EE06EB|nr:DUF2062 domain-containing protein [uncultured Sphingomonas sp.]
MAERASFFSRLVAKATPSREEVLESRWLKPFGQRIRHSELWRFTRRSVPRGVFAGLFIGIFLMIPGLQIVGAALLSMPLRANVPIAAAMTFLSNPATTPFFLGASILVGNKLGFHADLATFSALYESRASAGRWLSWLLSDAAPAVISGLFIIALACALVGYGVSIVVWRWWVHRKWRRRARPELFKHRLSNGDL